MDESVAKAFSLSIALFAGYSFIRLSPYRRFKAESLRSDRYAYHVLGIAFWLYIVGVLIALLIGVEDGRFADWWRQGVAYTHIQAPVMIALPLAAIAALVDSLATAFLMREDPSKRLAEGKGIFTKMLVSAIARTIRESDDSVLRLLWRATIYETPLMVSLKSGKVYVGKSAETISDPSVRAQSLKIIPFYSGYRSEETHKVELPTDYQRIYALLQERPEEESPTTVSDPLAHEYVDLQCKDGTLAAIDMQDMGVVICGRRFSRSRFMTKAFIRHSRTRDRRRKSSLQPCLEKMASSRAYWRVSCLNKSGDSRGTLGVIDRNGKNRESNAHAQRAVRGCVLYLERGGEAAQHLGENCPAMGGERCSTGVEDAGRPSAHYPPVRTRSIARAPSSTEAGTVQRAGRRARTAPTHDRRG